MKLHSLRTTTTDPRDRGREIGTQCADRVRDVSARYLAHFAVLGISETTVRDIAARSHDALRDWYPALAEESDAIAEASGIEPWQVAAVGARTEVLAAVPPGKGECTTAVYAPPAGGPPETIQTWDWHDALTPDGLLLSLVTGAGRRVKLFTEFGTAAKVGVNDAGLGLHFNILRHRSDRSTGGVPVHAVARRVLEEATTVAEARDIVASATLSASTVLTVVTYRDGRAAAASIEMAPSGIAVVEPDADGWIIHTNHFLDPGLADGDTSTPELVSAERYLHARAVRGDMTGRSATERAAAFCGGDGAAAVVCVHADESRPVHEQWSTLLTASLDLPGFALQYRAGNPDTAAREGLDQF
ncbi:C45 family peptidase [Streptomyces sp. TLI_105]|uniref:C45 family autoproteolytic acyltransferase/hydolase n=1 Tax=Streptomyces sp. TLI_105 TaxID=1881019 RepID=UPI00089D6475|nr:C45 family peptidase [Streptomyces sp. TLI_105]SEB59281.1 isopenicillin-N N-acyltransferase like protein [Streptomyces sp. TLI_105]